MNSADPPRLLAIVEVPSTEKVRCSQPGCNHTVYKAIHVVRDGGELLVLGSTCFGKRFGGMKALGAAQHGGGAGRLLTPEERMLLQENTEALLERFAQEETRMRQEMALKLQRLREAQAKSQSRPPAPPRASAAPSVALYGHRPLLTRPRFPWPWMMPASSVLAIKLRDGTGWVRVQHRDGRQFIVPWPIFEGWEEAMPLVVGRADPDVGGFEVMGEVKDALAFLRAQANRADEKITGLWADVLALLGDVRGQASL